MGRRRITRRAASLTAVCTLSLSLSLVIGSDVAASALPAGDVSWAKRYLTAVLAPVDRSALTPREPLAFRDRPAEPLAPQGDLGDLGIPELPVIEGPKGYVEGQSTEIAAERTERSKTYANPDGTRSTKYYAGPMHYEATPGTWTEIDSAWITSTAGVASLASPVPNFAPQDLTAGWISTSTASHYTRYRPLGVNPVAPQLTERYRASYLGAMSGTDFSVHSLPFASKSEFVVANSSSMRTSYVYEVQSDLSPVALPDGGFEWRDSEANPIFVTPPGVATDASYSLECIPASDEHRRDPERGDDDRNHSRDCWAKGQGGGRDRGHGHEGDESRGRRINSPIADVGLSLGKSGDTWLITATIDPEWAASPRRQFPVSVDPGVNWNVRADTFVTDSYPDLNRWSYESNGLPGHQGTYLPVRRVGRHGSYGHNRTLLHLSPDDGGNARFSVILGARMNVYNYSEANKSANPWWVLPMTDWNPYTVTWNNQPQYAPGWSGYMNIRNGAWMSSESPQLTDAVRNWLTGAWTSRGIALDGGFEEYKLVASAFDPDPGRRPHLNVTYNSPPEIAMPAYPSDGTVTETETPDFRHLPATDADGTQVKYQIRISTSPGMKTNIVAASSWSTDANRTWRAPKGVLRSDTTYFWGVFTSDGTSVSPSEVLRPAPQGWVRSIRIDSKGVGSKPGYSTQSYPIGSRASFSVNAESGNLMATVPGPAFPTATSPFSTALTYNSRVTRVGGLRGNYYSEYNRSAPFGADQFKMTRSDASVAFDWGDAVFATDINEDSFAVRWEGYIDIPDVGAPVYPALYHDDGARLYLGARGAAAADGVTPVVNAWTDSYSRRVSLPSQAAFPGLAPGTYPIRVEYYQNPTNSSDNSGIYLLWGQGAPNVLGVGVVPPSNLRPEISRLPHGWELAAPGAGTMRRRQIEAIETGGAIVRSESGASYTFAFKDGAYVAPEELHGALLSRAGDGTWTLADDDGSLSYFAPDGRPTSSFSAPDTEAREAPFQVIWDSDDLGPRVAEIRDLAGQAKDSSGNYINSDRRVTFEYQPTAPSSPTAGFLSAIHYWDSTETRIEYGPNGGLVSVTNPGDVRTAFSYNEAGLIESGRGARSFDEGIEYTTDIGYGPVDPGTDPSDYKVATITAPAAEIGGERPVVTYRDGAPSTGLSGDATHYREIEDPTGRVTTIGFDSARRAVATRDSAGLVATSSYDTASRVTRSTGPDGMTAYFDYDHSGNLISTRGPKVDAATGAYERTESRHDEGINGLYGTYYPNRNLSGAIENGTGGPALVRTDARVDFMNWGTGSPAPAVPRDNFSARWTGEIEIPAPGAYRFRAYSDDGVRVYLGGTKAIEDWSEHAPRDALSTYYELPAGKIPIRIEYFEAGGGALVRLDWEGPGFGFETIPTNRLHPGYGLTTTQIAPDSTRTTIRYGSEPHLGLLSQVEATTQGAGGEPTTLKSSASYIDHGRVKQTVRQPGDGEAEQVTTYAYYGLGETVEIPSRCGGGTAPQVGLPRRVTHPAGRAPEEGIYDDAGRIVSARLVGAPESEACVSYDARGRTTSVTAPLPEQTPATVAGAGAVSYLYNGDDALLSADDGTGGAVSQSFDRLGRMSSHTDANAKTTTFGYDLAGRMTTSAGPAGNKSFVPDEAGRLSVARWDFADFGTQTVGFSYDYAGRMATTTRSNSTTTAYSYSQSSELTGIEHLGPAGATIAKFRYDRDRFGRIATSYGPEGRRDYKYDDTGRLGSVDTATRRRVFDFDTHTNRVAKTDFEPTYRLAAQPTAAPPKYQPYAGTWRYNPHGTIFASANTAGVPEDDARLVYGPDTLRDYTAEVKVKFHSGAIDSGLDVRWRNGGDDRYIVAMRAGDIALHKISDGVPTWSAASNTAFTHTPGPFYELKVVTEGSRIRVYEGGVLALDYTDPDATDPVAYARSGHAEGAIALSSYRSWAEFGAFAVTDASGNQVISAAPLPRTWEGDWRPAGDGGLIQLGLGVHETRGLSLPGSDNPGDQEIRADLTFIGGAVDGGLRLRRNSVNGDAYVLALRADDIILIDTRNSSTLAQNTSKKHGVGKTYAIRVKLQANRVEVTEDGEVVLEADVSSPLLSGEVAPYSWESAMVADSLLVAPLPPSHSIGYGYNNSDQMTKVGLCQESTGCIAYDYRGNTTVLGGDRYRFDTSNRMIFSDSLIERAGHVANPVQVSPDGSAIVFSSNRDGNDEIYLMPPQGGPMTRLTNNSASDIQPTFSPDGATIYFSSNRDGDYEIYAMATDGTDQRRLTAAVGDDLYPATDPIGAKVIFASERVGNREIYTMSTDGTNPARLTNTPDFESSPRYSPAGDKVLYTVSTGTPLFQIGLLDLGTNTTSVLTSTGPNGLGEFRADGTRIVFTSWRDSGDAEIYSMASDGSDQVRLSSRAGEDAGPTYRSDGRIMFVSDRAGGSDIYTMAENGSDVAQVSSGAQVTSVPVMGTGSTTRAQVEYQYDALGRMRAMTTHTGALTQVLTYGYSGPTDSHSYVADGSGNIEFATFSGPSGLLATATKNQSASGISWYYADHRGDTRAIADSSGQVTWSASYSAYGEVAQSTGGTPAFGFVGAHRRITNPLTGLIHMGARMYEPTLGRFLSRDPILGGSANDYEYTSGDPMNGVDVDGRSHCMPGTDLIICAATHGTPVEPPAEAGFWLLTSRCEEWNRRNDSRDCPFDTRPINHLFKTHRRHHHHRRRAARPRPTSGRGGIAFPTLGSLVANREIARSAGTRPVPRQVVDQRMINPKLGMRQVFGPGGCSESISNCRAG